MLLEKDLYLGNCIFFRLEALCLLFLLDYFSLTGAAEMWYKS